MRQLKYLFAALLLAAPAVWADEPVEEVRLVYPMTAAEDVALDGSTPANRITPPVKEEGEYDPVTPIGQVRGIRTSLFNIEQALAALGPESLANLPTKQEFAKILPFLEQGAAKADEIETDVNELLKSNKLIGGRIEELAKATSDLRATVEAAQKTAASIESIRQSRWTDYAVLAILAIVLIQLSYRVVVGGYKKIKIIAKALEVANNAIQTELREAKMTVKKAVKE